MQTTVVIPMAGLGSRFAKAGWKMPKPFISFSGKMMVEHVIESFREVKDELQFVLILRDDFLKAFPKEVSELAKKGNVSFLSVAKVTQGAACTVLLAREYFRSGRLIVADSDTFYDPKVISDFFEQINQQDVSQSVITFPSTLPCFSYIQIDGKNVSVAEKQVISNHAISGVYYFRDGETFVESAIEAMIYGDREKGEFYMSTIFGKVAKNRGESVRIFEIQPEKMYCTGTPDQLVEVTNRLK